MEVGSWDVQRLPLLAKPAPRQSYAPMAGKPVLFSHEPPRHAEGTSELSTKLREKGLVAGRSLIPYMPILEAPTYAEHNYEKHRMAKQKPSAKRRTQLHEQTSNKTWGFRSKNKSQYQSLKCQMLIHCMQTGKQQY